MLDWIMQQDFMPHGHCYFWRADILWTHVISDGIIAAAYFSIPVTLLYFLRRRPDLPFPAMIALFATFIVLCGSGHILEIITVWNPVYALQGTVKAATALVSIATAVAMIPIIPQVLAMRTPQESQRAVDQAVAQLRETQLLLARNEKMAALGAVVAGLAHEINTPIGVGVTAASTLQGLSKDVEAKFAAATMTKTDLEKFLASARQSSDILMLNLQRAANLIQSFKQVAVDQSSGERRVFGLREYLNEVLLSLTPVTKKANCSVSVVCPETLTLDSYPGAIAQIVSNLVGNSLLHGFPDGRKGHVIISAREQDSKLIFEYSDDGVGVPAENLPKLFDPFFTTKRGAGGTGLGLHIVYNLATQTLGGAIDMASRENEGVKVTLELPAEHLQKRAPAAPAVKPALGVVPVAQG